jgi:hypothetical protein
VEVINQNVINQKKKEVINVKNQDVKENTEKHVNAVNPV